MKDENQLSEKSDNHAPTLKEVAWGIVIVIVAIGIMMVL